MSPTDFTISTKILECSYTLSENSLLNCLLEDHNGIQKEATHVSFIYIEPTNNYRGCPKRKDVFGMD